MGAALPGRPQIRSPWRISPRLLLSQVQTSSQLPGPLSCGFCLIWKHLPPHCLCVCGLFLKSPLQTLVPRKVRTSCLCRRRRRRARESLRGARGLAGRHGPGLHTRPDWSRSRPALDISVTACPVGLASFKAHVAPGASLSQREKRTESGRLRALGIRACPCAGGRPTATYRAFWSSSHDLGRSGGSTVHRGAGGLPGSRALAACEAGHPRTCQRVLPGSRAGGCRRPNSSPDAGEAAACVSACVRETQPLPPRPCPRGPGFLVPAARLRTFPLTDLNELHR